MAVMLFYHRETPIRNNMDNENMIDKTNVVNKLKTAQSVFYRECYSQVYNFAKPTSKASGIWSFQARGKNEITQPLYQKLRDDVVRLAGLEPARLKSTDFKSVVYADSTTAAYWDYSIMPQGKQVKKRQT